MLAARPMSVYETPEEVAISVVGVQEPVHLNMLYPAMPDPPESVDDAQVREIREELRGAATRLVGGWE